MNKTNYKAQQIPKKSKEDFFRERNTSSRNIEGLSLLQENTISYLHAGCSMSFIARTIYNVHPNTLRDSVNSALFIKILDDVNEAEKTISYQYIINKLYDIAEHSVNESNQIKALQILGNMLPVLSEKQIADILFDNSISVEEAEDIINRFHKDNKEGSSDEQEAN